MRRLEMGWATVLAGWLFRRQAWFGAVASSWLGIVVAQGTEVAEKETYLTSFILTDLGRQAACSNYESVVCV
jgi:hypothetical protein